MFCWLLYIFYLKNVLIYTGWFSPTKKTKAYYLSCLKWMHSTFLIIHSINQYKMAVRCLFLFYFGHFFLSCFSPWCCHSFWQGAKEGVASQGLHRPGLQHRRWGGWRGHLRLLHPSWRAGWPEWRAEEGWPDSLCQYLNLQLSVCPDQQL